MINKIKRSIIDIKEEIEKINIANQNTNHTNHIKVIEVVEDILSQANLNIVKAQKIDIERSLIKDEITADTIAKEEVENIGKEIITDLQNLIVDPILDAKVNLEKDQDTEKIGNIMIKREIIKVGSMSKNKENLKMKTQKTF